MDAILAARQAREQANGAAGINVNEQQQYISAKQNLLAQSEFAPPDSGLPITNMTGPGNVQQGNQTNSNFKRKDRSSNSNNLGGPKPVQTLGGTQNQNQIQNDQNQNQNEIMDMTMLQQDMILKRRQQEEQRQRERREQENIRIKELQESIERKKLEQQQKLKEQQRQQELHEQYQQLKLQEQKKKIQSWSQQASEQSSVPTAPSSRLDNPQMSTANSNSNTATIQNLDANNRLIEQMRNVRQSQVNSSNWASQNHIYQGMQDHRDINDPNYTYVNPQVVDDTEVIDTENGFYSSHVIKDFNLRLYVVIASVSIMILSSLLSYKGFVAQEIWMRNRIFARLASLHPEIARSEMEQDTNESIEEQIYQQLKQSKKRRISSSMSLSSKPNKDSATAVPPPKLSTRNRTDKKFKEGSVKTSSESVSYSDSKSSESESQSESDSSVMQISESEFSTGQTTQDKPGPPDSGTFTQIADELNGIEEKYPAHALNIINSVKPKKRVQQFQTAIDELRAVIQERHSPDQKLVPRGSIDQSKLTKTVDGGLEHSLDVAEISQSDLQLKYFINSELASELEVNLKKTKLPPRTFIVGVPAPVPVPGSYIPGLKPEETTVHVHFPAFIRDGLAWQLNSTIVQIDPRYSIAKMGKEAVMNEMPRALRSIAGGSLAPGYRTFEVSYESDIFSETEDMRKKNNRGPLVMNSYYFYAGRTRRSLSPWYQYFLSDQEMEDKELKKKIYEVMEKGKWLTVDTSETHPTYRDSLSSCAKCRLWDLCEFIKTFTPDRIKAMLNPAKKATLFAQWYFYALQYFSESLPIVRFYGQVLHKHDDTKNREQFYYHTIAVTVADTAVRKQIPFDSQQDAQKQLENPITAPLRYAADREALFFRQWINLTTKSDFKGMTFAQRLWYCRNFADGAVDTLYDNQESIFKSDSTTDTAAASVPDSSNSKSNSDIKLLMFGQAQSVVDSSSKIIRNGIKKAYEGGRDRINVLQSQGADQEPGRWIHGDGSDAKVVETQTKNEQLDELAKQKALSGDSVKKESDSEKVTSDSTAESDRSLIEKRSKLSSDSTTVTTDVVPDIKWQWDKDKNPIVLFQSALSSDAQKKAFSAWEQEWDKELKTVRESANQHAMEKDRSFRVTAREQAAVLISKLNFYTLPLGKRFIKTLIDLPKSEYKTDKLEKVEECKIENVVKNFEERVETKFKESVKQVKPIRNPDPAEISTAKKAEQSNDEKYDALAYTPPSDEIMKTFRRDADEESVAAFFEILAKCYLSDSPAPSSGTSSSSSKAESSDKNKDNTVQIWGMTVPTAIFDDKFLSESVSSSSEAKAESSITTVSNSGIFRSSILDFFVTDMINRVYNSNRLSAESSSDAISKPEEDWVSNQEAMKFIKELTEEYLSSTGKQMEMGLKKLKTELDQEKNEKEATAREGSGGTKPKEGNAVTGGGSGGVNESKPSSSSTSTVGATDSDGKSGNEDSSTQSQTESQKKDASTAAGAATDGNSETKKTETKSDSKKSSDSVTISSSESDSESESESISFLQVSQDIQKMSQSVAYKRNLQAILIEEVQDMNENEFAGGVNSDSFLEMLSKEIKALKDENILDNWVPDTCPKSEDELHK